MKLSAQQVPLPTDAGLFDMHWFETSHPEMPNLALSTGLDRIDTPLVRIHSECMTGDVFGSTRCDCGDQLSRSMELVATRGCGVIVYLRQEGRGIGLINKLRAYQLQESGLDTVEANVALGLPVEARRFDAAIEILASLGVEQLDLLTNNPEKVRAVENSGLALREIVPLTVTPKGKEVARYLKAKRDRMGHVLPNVP